MEMVVACVKECEKKISLRPSWCFIAQRVDEIKFLADYLTHQTVGDKIETISVSQRNWWFWFVDFYKKPSESRLFI